MTRAVLRLPRLTFVFSARTIMLSMCLGATCAIMQTWIVVCCVLIVLSGMRLGVSHAIV